MSGPWIDEWGVDVEAWRKRAVGNDGGTRMAFWRRMSAWVTRIDHFPPSWLAEYGKGEYGIVVVPCLFGLESEVGGVALSQYVAEAKALGFSVCGSQWGKARDQVEARAEADRAALAVRSFGFDGWVMNGEKLYEGGGKSGAYTEQFRAAHPTLPFGWSPEPMLSLDHGVLQAHGVCYMPQAYPLENGADVTRCAQVALMFGWDIEDVVPLIQAYLSPQGSRYAAASYRSQAQAFKLPALCLYTANQAADVPQYWRDLVVR